MGELFGIFLVFGPPFISLGVAKTRWPHTDLLPIFFCWLASLAIGIGVCWLTSLLIPLYLPVFTGLAAYWYAYYRMEENFRDVISGEKIERRATAPPKQFPTTPSIQRETNALIGATGGTSMAVKRRPLFHEKTDELEALVRLAVAKGDLRTLKSVRRELTFRSTARARKLAVKVETAIEKIEAVIRHVGSEIFTPNRKPEQRSLFPIVFDEAEYRKMKQQFVYAWESATLQGYNLKEFQDELVKCYGKSIVPFVRRFVQDVEDDNIEAEAW